MAMKRNPPKGIHACKPTGVYHDILCSIGTLSDEIEQLMRRTAIEIANQLQMKAGTAPVSKDFEI